MKIKLVLPVFIFLIIFSFFTIFKPSSFEKSDGERVIKLRETKIVVEVVDTDEERAQGLSGRTSLPQDRGMFFVFPQKSRHEFWMKDMKFPLDFIWIDEDKVVDLTRSVPYPKENESPVTIIPKVPVDKVLEVNAGVIDSSQVKIGDQLDGL